MRLFVGMDCLVTVVTKSFFEMALVHGRIVVQSVTSVFLTPTRSRCQKCSKKELTQVPSHFSFLLFADGCINESLPGTTYLSSAFSLKISHLKFVPCLC